MNGRRNSPLSLRLILTVIEQHQQQHVAQPFAGESQPGGCPLSRQREKTRKTCRSEGRNWPNGLSIATSCQIQSIYIPKKYHLAYLGSFLRGQMWPPSPLVYTFLKISSSAQPQLSPFSSSSSSSSANYANNGLCDVTHKRNFFSPSFQTDRERERASLWRERGRKKEEREMS